MTVAATPTVGILNEQLNVPAPPTFNEPLVQPVIVTDSKTRDCSVVTGVNPVPDTVTVEPSGPDVGLTVINGVTVNVCGRLTELVVVSVPTTGVTPPLPLGTANVHTKPPEPSVVMVFPECVPSEQALGVWVAELKETVAPAECENPEPVTE